MLKRISTTVVTLVIIAVWAELGHANIDNFKAIPKKIAENHRPPPPPPSSKIKGSVRPSPALTEKQKHIIAITIGAEASSETQDGQLAVFCVIANRLNTTLSRNSIENVIFEKNQFSFLWGKTLTNDGKVLWSKKPDAIKKLATTKYAKQLAMVNKIVADKYYNDVTNGRDFYLNRAIASNNGITWFDENTHDKKKIGNHTFVRRK
jgi:spore germination cell wall hydrolase CwlJ-like protein